jgi:hypothetical protein
MHSHVAHRKRDDMMCSVAAMVRCLHRIIVTCGWEMRRDNACIAFCDANDACAECAFSHAHSCVFRQPKIALDKLFFYSIKRVCYDMCV